MRTMMTQKDFAIGDVVSFGKDRGQQTQGIVVSLGRTKLQIRQTETRGVRKSHPVGTIWRVPPSYVTKITAASARRPSERILTEIRGVYMALSPESLFQNGKASYLDVQATERKLRAELKALCLEFGREVSLAEAFMPPTTEPTVTTAKPLGTFRKGDRVTFADKHGQQRVGFVKRVNRKTVSVTPEDVTTRGQYWRLSPHLLRHA